MACSLDGSGGGALCAVSSDCAAGQGCVSGACVASVAQCTQDSNCRDGFVCRAKQCVTGDGGVEDGGAIEDGGVIEDGGTSDAGTNDGGTCTSDNWAGYAQEFFAKSCTPCHAFESDYSAVHSGAGSIGSRIQSGSMPRGATLSTADKKRILAWLKCGAPQ